MICLEFYHAKLRRLKNSSLKARARRADHKLSLGKRLFLDSGTLTPLLKKLEAKGYITRCRCKEDERNLFLMLTEDGYAMKDQALHIPYAMADLVDFSKEDKAALYHLLYKLLGALSHE